MGVSGGLLSRLGGGRELRISNRRELVAGLVLLMFGIPVEEDGFILVSVLCYE